MTLMGFCMWAVVVLCFTWLGHRSALRRLDDRQTKRSLVRRVD